MTTLKELATKGELFSAGHRACAGCGFPQTVRLVLKAAERPVVAAVATGRIPIGTSPSVGIGASVTLGIRPEHVRIGGTDVNATVVNVELLGHERHVICDVGGHLIVIRQPTDWAGVRIGDAVRLSMDPHRVHVFDRASGERVVSQRPAIASLGSRFELLSPEEALALDAAIITAAVEPVVDLTQAELNGETTEVPVVDLTDRPADAGVRRDRDDPPR